MENLKIWILFLTIAGLSLVEADFEDQAVDKLGKIIKGGVRSATGADTCDAEHIGAGLLFCPMPGMPEENNFCCTELFTGKPACCNFFSKNLVYFLVGGGVLVALLITCCCCCCCACCRRKPSQPGMVVLTGPMVPTTYPNHPHHRLTEIPPTGAV